jgi:hypothetical protein
MACMGCIWLYKPIPNGMFIVGFIPVISQVIIQCHKRPAVADATSEEFLTVKESRCLDARLADRLAKAAWRGCWPRRRKTAGFNTV